MIRKIFVLLIASIMLMTSVTSVFAEEADETSAAEIMISESCEEEASADSMISESYEENIMAEAVTEELPAEDAAETVSLDEDTADESEAAATVSPEDAAEAVDEMEETVAPETAEEDNPAEAEEETSEEVQEIVIELDLNEYLEEAEETGYSDYYADSDYLLNSYLRKGIDNVYSLPVLYSSSYNGNKLSGITSRIYDELKSSVEAAAAGSTFNTKLVIQLESDDLDAYSWTAEELGVENLVTEDNKINRTAASAAAEILLDKNRAILSVIRDCPYELYWFANQYTVQKKYSVTVIRGGMRPDIIKFKSLTLEIGMRVSNEYRSTDEYTIDASKTARVGLAMENARAIAREASALSDYAKLNFFRQVICGLASYNNGAATSSYGNPWQIIYLFDEDPSTSIVCEGYAKGFQYLCDISTFNAYDMAVYSVSGEYRYGSIGGGHMWNIVHMNGENFLVDLTNCDGDIPTDKLFMIQPVNGSVAEGYEFMAGNAAYRYIYYDETKLIYSEDELSMTIAHHPVTVSAVPATYFTKGLSEGAVCSDCGTVLMEQQETPMLEPGRILTVGARGDDVFAVQEKLKELGYLKVEPDGIFGGITKSAVDEFQIANGLGYSDGMVGPWTLARMRSEDVVRKPDEPDVIVTDRTLVVGMTGDDVKAVQRRLIELGYLSAKADGIYGNLTKRAVSDFQISSGLGYADGKVGSWTLGKLNGEAIKAADSILNGPIELSRVLKVGMSGADVYKIQKKLVKLGYLTAEPDGRYGNMTKDAVNRFQKDQGLTSPDGMVGNWTIGKLNAIPDAE